MDIRDIRFAMYMGYLDHRGPPVARVGGISTHPLSRALILYALVQSSHTVLIILGLNSAAVKGISIVLGWLRLVACLARLSATSFPAMPTWAGTHWRVIVCPCNFNMVR